MAYHFDAALLRKLKECDLTKYFQSVAKDPYLEEHGNYFTGRCPHPDHEDEHPSFRIWHNPDNTWSWCCMSCHNGKKDISVRPGRRNYGTDIIAFIQWMSDYKGAKHILTFEESVLKALDFYNMALPVASQKRISQQEQYYRKLAALYHSYLLLHDSDPKRYYVKRGLTQQDASAFQIGTDGDRLIFPLYDGQKALKGFISRTIRGEDPKYIHSSAKEGFIKSEFLYGLYKFDRSVHTAYVTEGVMDVITATRYGIKNVCACLGTSFMESHAALLKEAGIKEVVLVFDGDSAGRKALDNAIVSARKAGLAVSVILLPEGEDLDSFCKKYTYQSVQQLETLKQHDYEYELEVSARNYKTARNTLQNQYLLPILKKAETITQDEEYILYRNYILNQFDIILEPRNSYVRKIKTDLADPVSAQAKAKTQAAATA